MTRIRTFTGALAALGCFAITACDMRTGNLETPATSSRAATAQPVEIGSALYTKAKMPEIPVTQPLPEPIIVDPAIVQYDLKVQVPAQLDAMIELIATPVEGPVDPNDPLICYHPRDLNKEQPYRRLRENDIVTVGQTLCRLDERNVVAQIEMSEGMIASSNKAIAEGVKALDSYRRVLEVNQKLYNGGKGPVSELEIENLRATVARLAQDLAQNEQTKVKSAGEELMARVQLTRYFIKSPVNGRIVKLLKSPGEFAKAGDVIMEIQSTERVRVEGKLDAQYATRLKKGMPAYIEPTVPLGPAPYANWHRQGVTCVAVTAHPGRPMIVSGGEDATALVWDAFKTRQSHRLPNPTGVGIHSIATTSAKAKRHLVATGGGDGKVRLWDLSNPDRLPAEPMKTLDGGHTAAVEALAFSPDGRYLASAAGRDVFIWDADGNRLYALPGEFRDLVTEIAFTPQATLVTIARDRSIRVWNLGDKGASQTDLILDHREGNVEVLGVSSDGSRVLFDKDSSRIDVVSLLNAQTIGTVQNTSGTMRFSGLAIFSPDDHYILTTCGDTDARGELQLWDAPAIGGRASERRRLVTPNRAAVTCAAFTTDPANPFVVVGTQYGGVHYWVPPSADERGKRLTGYVESWLPADARSVQVRIVMENPQAGDQLQDRSMATIIIPPEGDAPVHPGPRAELPVNKPTIQPASAVEPAGAVVPAVNHVPEPATRPMPPTPESQAAPRPPAVPPVGGGIVIPVVPMPTQ